MVKKEKSKDFDLDDLEELPVTCILTIGEKEFDIPMDPREFSTGTLGFYGNTKVGVDSKNRFQINFGVYLIGSKDR